MTTQKSWVGCFKGTSVVCARLSPSQRKVHLYLFQFDSVHSIIQPDSVFFFLFWEITQFVTVLSLISCLLFVLPLFLLPSLPSFLPFFLPPPFPYSVYSSVINQCHNVIFAHFIIHVFPPSWNSAHRMAHAFALLRAPHNLSHYLVCSWHTEKSQ